jgi:hypothetical protein
MRRLCFLLVVGMLVMPGEPAMAAAPPAIPSDCEARPDVAALDEYCDALPSADGRGVSSRPLKTVLPPKMVKRLEKAGPLGHALLAVPIAAPRDALGHRSHGRGLDAHELMTRGALAGAEEPASNPLQVAARAITGGELSTAFASLLFVSAVGVAGTAWMRFRRRYSP